MSFFPDREARHRALKLFWIFARIAAFVVGGGYVILPMVEQALVDRRKWLTRKEFVDMTAVIQTIPGIIAGNAAIYIGYRIAGIFGSLCALAGVAAPSVIVITVIAMFVDILPREVLLNAWVQGAFTGVKAAVCGLVLSTAIKMARQVFTGPFEVAVAAAGLVAVLFFPISPGFVMVAAGLTGIIYLGFRRRFFKGDGK